MCILVIHHNGMWVGAYSMVIFAPVRQHRIHLVVPGRCNVSEDSKYVNISRLEVLARADL